MERMEYRIGESLLRERSFTRGYTLLSTDQTPRKDHVSNWPDYNEFMDCKRMTVLLIFTPAPNNSNIDFENGVSENI